jgi:hypothetical protein
MQSKPNRTQAVNIHVLTEEPAILQIKANSGLSRTPNEPKRMTNW